MSHDSVQAGDRMMSKSETNERSTGCHIRINGVGHTAAASGTFVRIQRKDGNSLLELSVNVIVQGEPSSDCPGGAEGSALVALNGIPVPADHTVRSVDLTVRMDDHAGVGDKVSGRSDPGQSAVDRQIVTSGSLDLTWSPGTVSAPAIKTCAGDHLENYPDMIVELNGDVPRDGYDAGFTGIPIPEPGLFGNMALDAVLFEGRTSIPYTHFSLCLSAERRMARYVAWNVDGARMVKLPRSDFALDPRIDAEHQWGNALYSDNVLDRGHIARRADLCWGGIAEAQQANGDSFYYTNIAPQHQAYNQSSRQGLWGELEDHVFAQAGIARLRLSVQAGPIFRPTDIEYRGARIPAAFWKLIGWRDLEDLPRLTAFILIQEDLLGDLETTLTFEPFHLYQVSLEELSGQTGLDFSRHPDGDVMRHVNQAGRRLARDDALGTERQIRDVSAFRDIMI